MKVKNKIGSGRVPKTSIIVFICFFLLSKVESQKEKLYYEPYDSQIAIDSHILVVTTSTSACNRCKVKRKCRNSKIDESSYLQFIIDPPVLIVVYRNRKRFAKKAHLSLRFQA